MCREHVGAVALPGGPDDLPIGADQGTGQVPSTHQPAGGVRDLREEGLQQDIDDRDQLVADMHDAVQQLPDRVAFLEECVDGLEQLFKLRRHKPRPLDQRVS